jgi:hypothetical protein
LKPAFLKEKIKESSQSRFCSLFIFIGTKYGVGVFALLLENALISGPVFGDLRRNINIDPSWIVLGPGDHAALPIVVVQPSANGSSFSRMAWTAENGRIVGESLGSDD